MCDSCGMYSCAHTEIVFSCMFVRNVGNEVYVGRSQTVHYRFGENQYLVIVEHVLAPSRKSTSLRYLIHPFNLYMHSCTACIHLQYPCIHTEIHTYIHTYIHPFIHPSIRPCIHASLGTCMNPCIYASIHASMHTCIYPSIHT